MEQYIDAVYISSVNLGNTCIMAYDIKTGASIKSFRGHYISKNTLKAIGSEDYLISSQKDKPLLQCWELNKNEPMPLRFPVPGKVTTLAINNTDNEYCILGISEIIFMYSLSTGIQIAVINRHYQNVTCLEFTSCGNYFASAGEDGFVYLWSMATLFSSLHKADKPQIQPEYILGQHSDKVTGLVLSKFGMRGILITCSLDQSAKIFDLLTGRLRHNIIAKSGLTSVCCNLGGSQIFLGDEKGKVWGFNYLLDRDTTDLQLEGDGTKCHKKSVDHLTLDTNGDVIVTGSDEEVHVWSIVMSEKQKKITVPTLASQRLLHTGRGSVTNILVKSLDKEILNKSKLESSIPITSFSNQLIENILDLPIVFRSKREEIPFDPQEFRELAAKLMQKDKDKTALTKKENTQEKKHLSSLKTVKQLRQANAKIYGQLFQKYANS